jgi:hypothetical protein
MSWNNKIDACAACALHAVQRDEAVATRPIASLAY